DGKKANEALSVLNQFEITYAHDSNFIQLLARCHGLLKNKIELHQTQAEWHALRGEYKEAFQQLDIAISYAQKSPKKAALIKERKLSLQALKKKQEKLK